MRPRLDPFPIVTLALLAALCGCSAEASPRQMPGPPPRRVHIVEVERSSQPVVTEVMGTVRASRSATIAPLISGTVGEVRVGLGSSVRAGDVLVRLSARDVEARLEQTRTVSEQAGRDRARAVSLRQQEVISLAQYEAAIAQWDLARARYSEASSIAERLILRAPFTGVITAKTTSVGDTVLPGQPLLVLEARSGLRLEAQVPDTLGEGLTVGDRLGVSVEGIDGELDGRLAEIQPASDAASRTRLFKIDLPDAPGLRSGQFGRARISGGRSLVVTVPPDAVVHHGQLESVFVVESGVVRVRLVRSGRERGNRLEISSGLQGGESVASVGAGLVDGQRVEEGR